MTASSEHAPDRPVSGDPAAARPVLDAAGLGRVLDRIAHEILEKTGGGADVVLLGIPTRGTTLAARLAQRLHAFSGLEVPYACAGGVCSTCRAHLREGEVVMDTNHALEPDEVERGYRLTCQSRPTTPTVFIDFDRP